MINTPNLPQMALIKQTFSDRMVSNIEAEITSQFRSLGFEKKIRPGDKVAITVGSRGIAEMIEITRVVCSNVKRVGGNPFIFPAMGSHGGATAAGQKSLLASKGISEETVGAPVISNMQVVCLSEELGFPVYIDEVASKADHIIVINRIKPHTKFEGAIQSGLFKMMVFGMGKHQGAITAHNESLNRGFTDVLLQAGKVILKSCPILCGVAIVENSYHHVHTLKLIKPEHFEKEEPELLKLATSFVPKIPFEDIDLLIVDQIGKNISGTGMDTKIIGRNRDILQNIDGPPHIKRIFVRDLARETEGNAFGIGLADFTTDRLIKDIDIRKTAVNAITAMSPEKAALPMYFSSDRAAMTSALMTIGSWKKDSLKMVRIQDTMDLGTMYVSECLLSELPKHATILALPHAVVFDEAGNLPKFPSV